MLVSPNTSLKGSGISPLNLRARSPKRAGRLGLSRVKDGLAIGPLRATGGPPGGGVVTAASGGVGVRQPAASQGSGASLLDLPASGQGLLDQLRIQSRGASPLSAGLGRGSSSGPLSMGALQARHTTSLARFQQIDRQSRFLQASSSPLRSNGGFGLSLSTGVLSLLG